MKVYHFSLFLSLSITLQLVGCAGSASHKVVSSNQLGDTDLSCKTIESEIIKTQVIIDDVNKDREDMTGADVVDGILWFPFNLIAKDSNYRNATEAADRRIARLHELKKEKRCPTQSSKDVALSAASAKALSNKLRELFKLHQEAVLTGEEYRRAKTRVLDAYIATEESIESQVTELKNIENRTKVPLLDGQVMPEDFTGSQISGSYMFKNPADIIIWLRDGGRADMKISPHNVMLGPVNDKGQWRTTNSSHLCLRLSRLENGQEFCRKIIIREGSITLVSENISDPDWTLKPSK